MPGRAQPDPSLAVAALQPSDALQHREVRVVGFTTYTGKEYREELSRRALQLEPGESYTVKEFREAFRRADQQRLFCDEQGRIHPADELLDAVAGQAAVLKREAWYAKRIR